MGMRRAGRPLKFTTVKDLQRQIDDYFKSRPDIELTITGLALALNTSRETLLNYQDRTEYFDTIKKAKDRIQESYERSLRKTGKAGDIFALKNFGWKDKTETDINMQGTLSLGGAFQAIDSNQKAIDSTKLIEE